MHPRNRYKDCPPDLEALAASNAALRTYINPLTKALEVSKPGAVAELVKTLIRVDFKVESYSGVPEGYLVPSVTRSLNYLHFVEDLIGEARAKGLTHSVLQRRLQPSQKRIREAQDDDSSATLITVRGLDVGVGASCIFPILGCALHSNWELVGIDIDETSLASARSNSEDFKSRIDIRKSSVRDRPDISNTLCVAAEDGHSTVETFDFVMCNPPFFATPPSDEPRPFGGTVLERSCPGGEVQYVSALIDESVQLRDRIVWFTTMIGVKESMTAVLTKLHHVAEAETIRVYRLEQGNKNRWVIAWSFYAELCPHSIVGTKHEIDNFMDASDTFESRKALALKELRNFTPETGICGGDGYRFRVRLKVLDVVQHNARRFRVEILDIKGGEEAESRARSVTKKLEQLMLRKSRRWKKRSGGGSSSRQGVGTKDEHN